MTAPTTPDSLPMTNLDWAAFQLMDAQEFFRLRQLDGRGLTLAQETELLFAKDNYGKNPHAVAMGKIGGAKGGPARAKKLSPARRTEIARSAVKTRWAKEKKVA